MKLEAMWAVHDLQEEARIKMNKHNIYKAKFWIYEEQRYGTWDESKTFYGKQAEKDGRLRATSFADTKEGRAFRKYLVE